MITEIPATGHTEVVIPAVNATCTEEGLTEGTKCSVCDEIITAQQTVPATGHTNETIPAVAPTCTETGLTEGVKCSVCHAVLETQHTVLALGHTEEIIPAVNATCTASGLTAGKKCSVCGEVLAAQQTIPATGHTYTAVVTPASCGERGYTTHTCNLCGDVRVDSFVEVKDHEYEGGNCVYCGLTHSDYFTFTELADGTYSIKMKDKNDQYIWQPSMRDGQPDTLLGAPVYMSEYAPNTYTGGNYAAVYGDFKTGYWICDSDGLFVQILTEIYAINNQNGYLVEYFGDGAPVVGEAFSRLKIKAGA